VVQSLAGEEITKSNEGEAQMDHEDLHEALAAAQDRLMLLDHELARFLSQPLVHATVVAARNELDPSKFEANDLVSIVGCGKLDGRTGRIVGRGFGIPAVDDEGKIEVIFPNLKRQKFYIGLGSDPRQVKLLGKNDGTNVTICADGTPYEVHGVFGKRFTPGQAVKVNLDTKQIVESEGLHGAGDICFVKTVVDTEHIEVEIDGKKRIVLNGRPDELLEPSDRVQLDRSNTVIIRHLKRDNDERFRCDENIDVPWESVGGCEEAKDALVDLVELPFAHPEVYKFYNKQIPKGGLLYGPPGCGKTLLGKASYTSLAKRFGKKAMASGWIYVKGPELLNMWLGNTEENIRELFHRGRKHYRDTGFPAVMFIDEAEAILGVRGAHVGSDFERTAVPMFLSEMDGLEASHVIVLLATNRPEMLDPAVIRHGRCDRHIKVPRPNVNTAAEIFKIHLRGVPLFDTDADTVAAVTTAELFSKQFVLYRILETISLNGHKHQKQHTFCLKDAINGAMIAGVVEQAVSDALKRDLARGSKKGTGVSMKDFACAVQKVYKGQVDLNHKFDIEDFLDINKISRCDLAIDKLSADL
jgi:proteasome-associated ATPase